MLRKEGAVDWHKVHSSLLCQKQSYASKGFITVQNWGTYASHFLPITLSSIFALLNLSGSRGRAAPFRASCVNTAEKKNYLLRLYLRCLNLLGTAICEEFGTPKFSSQTRHQQYLCWVFCRIHRMYCKSLTWCIVFASARTFVQSAVATLRCDPLWNSLHDLEACNMTSLQYLHDFCHTNCLLIASLQDSFFFHTKNWRAESEFLLLNDLCTDLFLLVLTE